MAVTIFGSRFIGSCFVFNIKEHATERILVYQKPRTAANELGLLFEIIFLNLNGRVRLGAALRQLPLWKNIPRDVPRSERGV